MSGQVLFYMSKHFRMALIVRHLFYVEQARKRLLSRFDDMEAEADKVSEDWLEGHSHNFDPDRDEASDFYEAANDAGSEFYQLLSDMRTQTYPSVTAGIFHEWDKHLRDWLVTEIRHWNRGDTAASKVWSVDFGKSCDLLESFGWSVRSEDYFTKLDACRLVVNVYKHGKGNSLAELKQRFPEFLRGPFGGSEGRHFQTEIVDHTFLSVNDDQFQAFSDAIVAFWNDVPECIDATNVSSVPGWFESAIVKDRLD